MINANNEYIYVKSSGLCASGINGGYMVDADGKETRVTFLPSFKLVFLIDQLARAQCRESPHWDTPKEYEELVKKEAVAILTHIRDMKEEDDPNAKKFTI